ncbi:hypothetical protein [Polyangium aurulentum]|uniref:hypothetical protein n=1 Tax=Polyangium aurulentum TaxID=2567896 RepID=UPI0010AEBC17|nr:hypothetical protein [Polyangium aurulentum]UQA61419.1 hypothetical protein E8A73_013465 [Polyangium aurulentum]
MSKRTRRNHTSEQKAARLKRHHLEKVPISSICDDSTIASLYTQRMNAVLRELTQKHTSRKFPACSMTSEAPAVASA